MSTFRSVIVMCLGLFLVLHGISEAFDGVATVSSRTGTLASYAYNEDPDAFVRTVILNICLGLVAIGFGYYAYRKSDK